MDGGRAPRPGLERGLELGQVVVVDCGEALGPEAWERGHDGFFSEIGLRLIIIITHDGGG